MVISNIFFFNRFFKYVIVRDIRELYEGILDVVLGGGCLNEFFVIVFLYYLRYVWIFYYRNGMLKYKVYNKLLINKWYV